MMFFMFCGLNVLYVKFLCGCLAVCLGAHERSWTTCDGNYRVVRGPAEAQVIREMTNRKHEGSKGL